jgi:hypothetical protein
MTTIRVLIIDRALETAALMLGSDRSCGYCLEMIGVPTFSPGRTWTTGIRKPAQLAGPTLRLGPGPLSDVFLLGRSPFLRILLRRAAFVTSSPGDSANVVPWCGPRAVVPFAQS